MGNDRFEDGTGLDDCENCSMVDPVRLFGLICSGLGFDPHVCVCVRSDDPSSFVSQHKKNR